MKHSITKMMTVLFGFILLAQVTVAQNNLSPEGSETLIAKADITLKGPNVISNSGTAAVSKAGNNRVDAKFASMFPSAQQAQWLADGKGFWVSFVNDGCKTRAGFTKNGQLNYIIKDALWNNLSASLQRYITKNYIGYEFFNAIEINAFGENSQQVILQSATTFITLNAGVEGIEEIKKVIKPVL